MLNRTPFRRHVIRTSMVTIIKRSSMLISREGDIGRSTIYLRLAKVQLINSIYLRINQSCEYYGK